MHDAELAGYRPQTANPQDIESPMSTNIGAVSCELTVKATGDFVQLSCLCSMIVCTSHCTPSVPSETEDDVAVPVTFTFSL